MNADQAKQVIRLVTGYWPNPQLTEDEAAVWGRALAVCDSVQLAAAIVDGLALTGREFRPNAGHFAAEYQARKPRFVGTPIDRDELPLTTEHKSRAEWMAEAHDNLNRATGPLAKDLRQTVDGAS